MRRSSAAYCTCRFLSTCFSGFVFFGVAGVLQAQTVLFEDAFDSETVGTAAQGQILPGPVGSTPWTFVLDETNQNDVRYGYDYSLLGIPEAPNSDPSDASTTGVALRTNVSGGQSDQAGIFVEDEAFTGQFRVEVDMWLSWAINSGRIGSTEHAGLFIGKDTPSNPANPNFPASTGAGAIFSSDEECTNCSHTILKNDIYPDTFSGQFSIEFARNDGTPQLGYDNTDVNTDPSIGPLLNLPEFFPAIEAGNTGQINDEGVVSFRWVTLTADVDTEAVGIGTGGTPGTTTFTVTNSNTGESFVLGTVDNSVIDDPNDGIDTGEAPVDMAGRVTLSIIDFFDTPSGDLSLGTVIFDNLSVTAVEPTLEGDYNGDGEVNAADYTVYRDTLNDTVPVGEGADGNGNGTIDPGDYTIWAANFGDSLPALGSAVPEPSAALITALSLGAMASRGRRS